MNKDEHTAIIVLNEDYEEYGKLRHINLRHEYVRPLIQSGIIDISYVRSSENLADPFIEHFSRE